MSEVMERTCYGVLGILAVIFWLYIFSYPLSKSEWHCTSYSYEKQECIVYSKEK